MEGVMGGESRKMKGRLESKLVEDVHVVVVPFPDGQGHINPILQFSKCLALKGLKVTVLNIVGANHQHQLLNLDNPNSIKISVHHRPRLPCQSTEDPAQPLESLMRCLQNSISFHLAQLVAHHRTSPAPVRCVVYDSVTPWVLDMARHLGLPGAPFFTESCAVNAIYYHLHRGWLHIPIHQTSLSSLPALPPLQISDLPSLLSHPHQYPGSEAMMIHQFSNTPDWMFINTFNALEPQVLEWIQKHTPLKAVGPTVIPSIITDKRLKDDHHYEISLFRSNGSDDRNIIEWLDSKDTHSVVYVSFGSAVNLGEEQMDELAWGLKAANKYFLWAVREESQFSNLPTNFLDEEIIKEKGMVVKWCPQLQVLAHKSVGCFLTHCGWNSVLEALSFGVPMVAMPQWTDQTTNAKFVADVWNVGVRVNPKENGIVGREEIELSVNRVMEGERRVEMRENATKLMKLAKEAVDEAGTSDKNIDEFVAQLQDHKI